MTRRPSRRARRRALAGAAVVPLVATSLVLLLATADAGAAPPRWSPPVAGPVVARFREPLGPFGPGHRGVDYSAPVGTTVRAAGRRARHLRGSGGRVDVRDGRPRRRRAHELRLARRRSASPRGPSSSGARCSGRPARRATATRPVCSTSACASATATSTRCCCSGPWCRPRWSASCRSSGLVRPRSAAPQVARLGSVPRAGSGRMLAAAVAPVPGRPDRHPGAQRRPIRAARPPRTPADPRSSRPSGGARRGRRTNPGEEPPPCPS